MDEMREIIIGDGKVAWVGARVFVISQQVWATVTRILDAPWCEAIDVRYDNGNIETVGAAGVVRPSWLVDRGVTHRTCPVCHGTGEAYTLRCQGCSGSGQVPNNADDEFLNIIHEEYAIEHFLNERDRKPTTTLTLPVDDDILHAFRREFMDVLAESADEVGIHGAVHITDDGVVTVRTDHDGIRVQQVRDWFSNR